MFGVYTPCPYYLRSYAYITNIMNYLWLLQMFQYKYVFKTIVFNAIFPKTFNWDVSNIIIEEFSIFLHYATAMMEGHCLPFGNF